MYQYRNIGTNQGQHKQRKTEPKKESKDRTEPSTIHSVAFAAPYEGECSDILQL